MAKGYSARRGFTGGAGMMQQQAQMQQKLLKMQQDMAKAQEEVEKTEFTASVGGGAVTAVVTGKKELTKLTIKPDVIDPEDAEHPRPGPVNRDIKNLPGGEIFLSEIGHQQVRDHAVALAAVRVAVALEKAVIHGVRDL